MERQTPKRKIHPLLVRGESLTETIYEWTLAEYPHQVAGMRAGFEVRIYDCPADGFARFLIAEIGQEHGWIVQTENVITAQAARAAAQEILSQLAELPERTQH